MENNVVIKVSNITKKFKIYLDKGHSLKERVVNISRNRYEIRNVINDISFEIKRGEVVGLIGHNGCGKSTTLKMLTRIMYPDSGTVRIDGRVSSLLELGAGFHPDMTGRENIYTNASIFGLKKKEIDAKLQNIIDFSELGDYIDNPVRTYSSGMYMRLAFSVAINVNADILLIDEILAVGDVNFQEKCFNKLLELKEGGATIVIVSHSMEQVERICNRSIWIHEGKIRADGDPKDVGQQYLTYMHSKQTGVTAEATNESETEKNKESGVKIVEVAVLDESGEKTEHINYASDMTVLLKYESKLQNQELELVLSINTIDGAKCFCTDYEQIVLPSKDGEIRLVIEDVQLLDGEYEIDITLKNKDEEIVECIKKAALFEIKMSPKSSGIMWMKHRWILNN